MNATARRKGPRPKDEFRTFWLIYYAHDGLGYTVQEKHFIKELWAAVKAWQCKRAIANGGKKSETSLPG